jgi:hypothetical protein
MGSQTHVHYSLQQFQSKNIFGKRRKIIAFSALNQHLWTYFFHFLITSSFRYRHMWDALLKSVRCAIISFTRNEQIDAYVLR